MMTNNLKITQLNVKSNFSHFSLGTGSDCSAAVYHQAGSCSCCWPSRCPSCSRDAPSGYAFHQRSRTGSPDGTDGPGLVTPPQQTPCQCFFAEKTGPGENCFSFCQANLTPTRRNKKYGCLCSNTKSIHTQFFLYITTTIYHTKFLHDDTFS